MKSFCESTELSLLFHFHFYLTRESRADSGYQEKAHIHDSSLSPVLKVPVHCASLPEPEFTVARNWPGTFLLTPRPPAFQMVSAWGL